MSRLRCLKVVAFLSVLNSTPPVDAFDGMMSGAMESSFTEVITESATMHGIESTGWDVWLPVDVSSEPVDDIMQKKVIVQPGSDLSPLINTMGAGFTFFLPPGIYTVSEMIHFKPGIKITGIPGKREPWESAEQELRQLLAVDTYGVGIITDFEQNIMLVGETHYTTENVADLPIIIAAEDDLEVLMEVLPDTYIKNVIINGNDVGFMNSGCQPLIRVKGKKPPRLNQLFFQNAQPCQIEHGQHVWLWVEAEKEKAVAVQDSTLSSFYSKLSALFSLFNSGVQSRIETESVSSDEDECDGVDECDNGIPTHSGQADGSQPMEGNGHYYLSQMQDVLQSTPTFSHYLMGVQIILEWFENMHEGQFYTPMLNALGVNMTGETGRRALYWAIAYRMLDNKDYFMQFFKAVRDTRLDGELILLLHHLNTQLEQNSFHHSMLHGMRPIYSPPASVIRHYKKHYEKWSKKITGWGGAEEDRIPVEIRRRLVKMLKSHSLNRKLVRRLGNIMTGRVDDLVEFINQLEPFVNSHESVEQFAYLLSQAQHALAKVKRKPLSNHVSIHHLPYRADARIAMGFVISSYMTMRGDLNALVLALQYLLSPEQVDELASPGDRMFGHAVVQPRNPVVTSELLSMPYDLSGTYVSTPWEQRRNKPFVPLYGRPHSGSPSRQMTPVYSRPNKHNTGSPSSLAINFRSPSIGSVSIGSASSLMSEQSGRASIRSRQQRYYNPDGFPYADQTSRSSTASSGVSDRSVQLPSHLRDSRSSVMSGDEQYVPMAPQINTPVPNDAANVPPPLPARNTMRNGQPVSLYEDPPVSAHYDTPNRQLRQAPVPVNDHYATPRPATLAESVTPRLPNDDETPPPIPPRRYSVMSGSSSIYDQPPHEPNLNDPVDETPYDLPPREPNLYDPADEAPYDLPPDL